MIAEDCSSFFTGVYYEAGAPDPNGRGYDGTGFTGTMAQNGRRVLAPPRPGDANMYGPAPTYSHTTVSISASRCISHGSQPGPYLLDIRYRRDYKETLSFLP